MQKQIYQTYNKTFILYRLRKSFQNTDIKTFNYVDLANKIYNILLSSKTFLNLDTSIHQLAFKLTKQYSQDPNPISILYLLNHETFYIKHLLMTSIYDMWSNFPQPFINPFYKSNSSKEMSHE